MGNNAHLKNQSKLINTFEQSYGYIIKLNRRGKPSVLRIKWSFFVKPWGSFTQGRFVPNLVEIGPVVLGRKIFKLGKYIFAILSYLSLEKGHDPSFEQISVPNFRQHKSPSPKDDLCQVWLNLAQWFWGRGFLNFVNVFSLFCNNLPLQQDLALHLNNFQSPSPRMICAKFGWNWPSGSGEEDF